jgi:hypothetical protein
MREHGAWGTDVCDIHWHDVPAKVQLRGRRCVCACQKFFGYTERSEYLQRARVYEQGARRPERLEPALDDADACAVIVGL